MPETTFMTEAGAFARSGDGIAGQHGDLRDGPVQPVVLRLDGIPATAENRNRVNEYVRRLNRALEESGTPFRLRLL
jgi:hypothetical protein